MIFKGLLCRKEHPVVPGKYLQHLCNLVQFFNKCLTWFFGEECLFLEMPVGFIGQDFWARHLNYLPQKLNKFHHFNLNFTSCDMLKVNQLVHCFVQYLKPDFLKCLKITPFAQILFYWGGVVVVLCYVLHSLLHRGKSLKYG